MGYANKSSVIAFLIMSSLATCFGASPMEEKIVTALEMRKEGIKWSEIFGDKIKPSAKYFLPLIISPADARPISSAVDLQGAEKSNFFIGEEKVNETRLVFIEKSPRGLINITVDLLGLSDKGFFLVRVGENAGGSKTMTTLLVASFKKHPFYNSLFPKETDRETLESLAVIGENDQTLDHDLAVQMTLKAIEARDVKK